MSRLFLEPAWISLVKNMQKYVIQSTDSFLPKHLVKCLTDYASPYLEEGKVNAAINKLWGESICDILIAWRHETAACICSPLELCSSHICSEDKQPLNEMDLPSPPVSKNSPHSKVYPINLGYVMWATAVVLNLFQLLLPRF